MHLSQIVIFKIFRREEVNMINEKTWREGEELATLHMKSLGYKIITNNFNGKIVDKHQIVITHGGGKTDKLSAAFQAPNIHLPLSEHIPNQQDT